MVTKAALREHVSVKAREEGAEQKKPRLEEGPAPNLAEWTAVQREELLKLKNKAKKDKQKEKAKNAKALTEIANRLDEVTFNEAKALSEEEEKASAEAAKKKAKV